LDICHAAVILLRKALQLLLSSILKQLSLRMKNSQLVDSLIEV